MLNIVWDRQIMSIAMESQFINIFLSSILDEPAKVTVYDRAEQVPEADHMIAVIPYDDRSNFVRGLRSKAKVLGVMHMGDERGDANLSYNYADYVLRNYYYSHIVTGSSGRPPVIWVPNGYRNGVGPWPSLLRRPPSQRTNFCFFSGFFHPEGGQGKSHRDEMVQTIRSQNVPCSLFASQKCGDGFPPQEYAVRLADSIFGLVPYGGSPETIRLYDCLEVGTIPVMLSMPATSTDLALGTPPFPVFQTWNEAASFLNAHKNLDDPAVMERLEDMQNAVTGWWHKILNSRREAARQVIEAVCRERR